MELFDWNRVTSDVSLGKAEFKLGPLHGKGELLELPISDGGVLVIFAKVSLTFDGPLIKETKSLNGPKMKLILEDDMYVAGQLLKGWIVAKLSSGDVNYTSMRLSLVSNSEILNDGKHVSTICDWAVHSDISSAGIDKGTEESRAGRYMLKQGLTVIAFEISLPSRLPPSHSHFGGHQSYTLSVACFQNTADVLSDLKNIAIVPNSRLENFSIIAPTKPVNLPQYVEESIRYEKPGQGSLPNKALLHAEGMPQNAAYGYEPISDVKVSWTYNQVIMHTISAKISAKITNSAS